MENNETTSWANPVDHFRPQYKILQMNFDRHWVIDRLLKYQERILGNGLLMWWNPMYFIPTHYQQRNRNLSLLMNNLNYKPYKWRADDINSNY